MHDKTIRRRRAVLAVLVAVSLILLTAYFGESPNSPLHAVQRGVVAVIAPIQSGASTVFSPFRDIAGFISSTINAKSQNTQLKRQVETLHEDYARLQYQMTQYQQAEKVLALNTSEGLKSYSPVWTSVIGKDPVLWYNTIEVGAGSGEGVRVNDPVIGPGGLVGDVTRVDSDYSIVTMLTSPQFAVGAMVVTGAHNSYTGILQPKVGNPQQLLLSSLQSTAQISSGDNVVCSGFREVNHPSIESWCPPGILIGTVSTPATQIQDSLINTQQLDVSPAVDLQQLSLVQILTRPQATTQSASLP